MLHFNKEKLERKSPYVNTRERDRGRQFVDAQLYPGQHFNTPMNKKYNMVGFQPNMPSDERNVWLKLVCRVKQSSQTYKQKKHNYCWITLSKPIQSRGHQTLGHTHLPAIRDKPITCEVMLMSLISWVGIFWLPVCPIACFYFSTLRLTLCFWPMHLLL